MTGWEAERERLRKALEICQSALAMMIEPGAITRTTLATAYAQAVEAEVAARAALSESKEQTADASKRFADWLNIGPSLAKEAGCYVGIKVTAAKVQP